MESEAINNITIAKAVDEGYYVKEGFKVVSDEFLEDGIYDALERNRELIKGR